jgi:hypothetical protein
MRRLQNKPLPLSVKDEAINELEKELEQKYIQYCDPSIPLHLITILMTKLGIAKLRLAPRHPASTANLPAEEKDLLFRLSLESLEYHNEMMASSNLERFLWFVMRNFPFPAQVYLLCSLRYRTNDKLADRAWRLIEVRHKTQNMASYANESRVWRMHKESAIHLAILNLLVKAWEAREKAQPGLPTPGFIQELRQELALKRPPKSTNSSVGTEVTTPAVAPAGVADQFAESYKWFNPGSVDSNQGFDLMPGLVTNDPQSMGWDFWNDLMQPTIPGYPYDGVGGPLQPPNSG